jgi:hypothetical protein
MKKIITLLRLLTAYQWLMAQNEGISNSIPDVSAILLRRYSIKNRIFNLVVLKIQ